MAILDIRRADQRTNVLENPVWLTSAIFDNSGDDTDIVLFSFPINSKYGYFSVIDVCVETIEAWTGGTITFTLGTGTIATNATTTGGSLASVVDADFYVKSFAKAGMSGTGLAFPDSSAFVTAKAAGTSGVAGNLITCADSAVPVIYGDLASSAPITAGQSRVHILGSYVPVQ